MTKEQAEAELECALDALTVLKNAEIRFLEAFGWRCVDADKGLWHAPPEWSARRPSDYEYTQGHAINAVKQTIGSLKGASLRRVLGQ